MTRAPRIKTSLGHACLHHRLGGTALVSVLASAMTQFALTGWAQRETGSALALGAFNTFFLIPFLLLPPVAGAMLDRYNRKITWRFVY